MTRLCLATLFACSLTMLAAEDPDALEKLAARWTRDTTVQDDVHYLIAASLLPGERSESGEGRS